MRTSVLSRRTSWDNRMRVGAPPRIREGAAVTSGAGVWEAERGAANGAIGLIALIVGNAAQRPPDLSGLRSRRAAGFGLFVDPPVFGCVRIRFRFLERVPPRPLRRHFGRRAPRIFVPRCPGSRRFCLRLLGLLPSSVVSRDVASGASAMRTGRVSAATRQAALIFLGGRGAPGLQGFWRARRGLRPLSADPFPKNGQFGIGVWRSGEVGSLRCFRIRHAFSPDSTIVARLLGLCLSRLRVARCLADPTCFVVLASAFATPIRGFRVFFQISMCAPRRLSPSLGASAHIVTGGIHGRWGVGNRLTTSLTSRPFAGLGAAVVARLRLRMSGSLARA